MSMDRSVTHVDAPPLQICSQLTLRLEEQQAAHTDKLNTLKVRIQAQLSQVHESVFYSQTVKIPPPHNLI